MTSTSASSNDTHSDKRRPIGYKPIALDGGYGWWVVLGSFLIHVFADGFLYSFGVFGESLVKRYNASNKSVSMILSVLSGLMYLIGPISAIICNRVGCRAATIVGAIVAVIGCAASFFATRLAHLVLTVGVVMGVGFGLMYCPALVIVTMYFEKKRSLATGITVCGSGVGTLIFSKLIGFLLDKLPAEHLLTVFPIYAGLLLLCIPCGFLFRPFPCNQYMKWRKIARKIMNSKKNRKEILVSGERKNIRTSLLANPVYVLFVCASVLNTVGFNAVPMFIPMNAESEKGLRQSKQTAATTVSAYGLANMIGRLLFGLLCDRQLPFHWGKDCARNRIWIFSITLFISGLACCFVFSIASIWVYVIFCAFFGFMVSSYASLTSVVMVDLIGVDRLTNGLGLLFMFHGIACVLGPLVGGHLFDTTCNYSWTFIFFGSSLMAGGLVLPFARLIYKRRRMGMKDDQQSLLDEDDESAALMTATEEGQSFHKV
uniref:Major facilitator superfamily (MFS) profile domain-containing protein n=1 Tax=Ditylenchus dipsaci TaxID=166011 RepID=A0A915DUG8_9BILA